MPTEFRWEDWNVDLATKHGCTIAEIENLVRFPPSGFPRTSPRRSGPNQAWIIEGRGLGGRPIEVIFLMDDDEETAVVIHAQYLAPKGRRGRR
jgi:hypothetical protein